MLLLNRVVFTLAPGKRSLGTLKEDGSDACTLKAQKQVVQSQRQALTVKPWSSILRTKFWPMTARPMRPMSATGSVLQGQWTKHNKDVRKGKRSCQETHQMC